MDAIERRLAHLRAEMSDLNILLSGTTDAVERRLIRACLSECFRESIELVEQRIRASASVQGDVLLERSAGQSTS